MGKTTNLTQELSLTHSGMLRLLCISWLPVWLACLIGNSSYAQDQKIADSLAKVYQTNNLQGKEKLQLLSDLAFNEVEDLRLAVQYAEELIAEATAAGDNQFLYRGYFQKGNKKRQSGDLPEALEAYFKSAEIANKAKLTEWEALAYAGIADVYGISNRHDDAMDYYRKAIATLRIANDSVQLASIILNAGEEFRLNKFYDSALIYFGEAKTIFERKKYPAGIAYAYGNTGMVYANLGNNGLAEKNFSIAIPLLENQEDYYPICDYLLSMCDMYVQKKERKVALNYALSSLDLAEHHHLKEQIRNASLKASDLYQSDGNFEKSLGYFKEYVQYRDSIDNLRAVEKMAELQSNFKLSRKQAEVNLLNRQKELQRFFLIVSLIVLVVIGGLVVVLFRNYRQKQKAFTLLGLEKAVTEKQRDQTNIALEKLQRTQAHLVQSEKLASLGQLTAGIAHEIQNPLNFVNNFSEVNAELIVELQEANKKGNSAAVQAISEELSRNEEKISHHGKRADAIVKGMLQHSRPGEREKKPTDINALANEYFRLAYHGQRVKDKSFITAMHTDFDPLAGEINIIPQEIGRVILNLVNNAFYAVSAKSKESHSDFIPSVTVGTKREINQFNLFVKDNGIGIPSQVKDNIFQPFFTTKGPGIGTGLGLSISYDIVKAHGGEIKVESEEGEGTEFSVILPIDRA
jgi:two-component system, NtrC family, sensor kinase